MLTAGCDIGALTTKAALIRDDVLLGCEVVRSRSRSVQSATDAMGKLLGEMGFSYGHLDYCISTGYGRNLVPFAHSNMSEISCHARGAHWLIPSVRTVIDGGGQDCKAIRVSEQGRLVDFRMNIQDAIDSPRIHCMTDTIFMESSIPKDVQAALAAKGHKVTVRGPVDLYFGGAQAVMIDLASGRLYGAGDPRRDGVAIGY